LYITKYMKAFVMCNCNMHNEFKGNDVIRVMPEMEKSIAVHSTPFHIVVPESLVCVIIVMNLRINILVLSHLHP